MLIPASIRFLTEVLPATQLNIDMSSEINGRFLHRALAHYANWRSDVRGQRRRFATVGVAVLALGMFYHVVFGQNGLTSYLSKKSEAKELSIQLETLRAENEALKEHVVRLKDDPGEIEHQAREQLHYARPGEVIVTLPATSSQKP